MSTTASAAIAPAVERPLLPVSAIVFLGFLSLSMLMPTVAIHVGVTLGFGDMIAGLVVGLQSFATVATRHHAGKTSDLNGPHAAVRRGLPLLALGGLLGFAATLVLREGALALLLASRVCLGVGESLMLTGAMSWGIARAGSARSGRVIAWQGLGMFGALIVGAPLGLALADRAGFAVVAAVATLLPIAALIIARLLAPEHPVQGARLGFVDVARLIGRFGLILACAGVPYALLSAFIGLWFVQLGWPGKEAALAAFGGGYVVMRLFFADLPARRGARPVAMASLLTAVVGMLLVGLAPTAAVAIAGALLSGLGFSLIYPALGVQLVKITPPASRGAALGGFSAFFDIAIGVASPLGGLIATHMGYQTVFLAAAVAQLVALALVATLRER